METNDDTLTSSAAPSGDAEQLSLRLASRLEALLFVANEPIPVGQLVQALETSQDCILAALDELAQECRTRGLRLQQAAHQVQMVTAPEAAADVQKFLGLETSSKLSPAALETMALIAYQQPITRARMEAIRGVNCDGVLRTLLSRGLVAPQGRLEQAGRPIVYGTTFEFMQYFGLAALSDLPRWHEFSATAEGKDDGSGRTAH